MRILITGINGFAASHLARFLVKEGHEVHGTVRVRSDLSKLDDIFDKITMHLVEITDNVSVGNVIKLGFDEIYHLAAQSFVKSSWETPLETYRINIEGTINLLEECRKAENQPSILITSTSEIYGTKHGAMNEDTIADPNTHYGISKYAQDMIARLYHKAYGMKVIVSRSFNITGSGRADVFVDSSFAKQIVEIEKGKRDCIKHGNLESARDFTDVEDIVRGYVSIIRSEKWGEVFCLASEQSTKIRTILDILIGLTDVDVKTELDMDRMRPIDTPTMTGDATKANTVLGWVKTVSIEKSLENLLNYWRERIK